MRSFDGGSEEESKHADPYINLGNNEHYKFAGELYKITEDSFTMVHSGFSVAKNNIFYRILQKNIQKLYESGITQYYMNHSSDYTKSFEKYTGEREDWAPLSMENLRAGFVIWFVTVIMSIIVFIYEIIHYKYTKRLFPKNEKTKRIARRKRNFLRKKKMKNHMNFIRKERKKKRKKRKKERIRKVKKNLCWVVKN